MLGRIFLPTIVLALAYGLWSSSHFQDIAAGVALFLFGMLCMEQGFKTFSGGTLQSLLSACTDKLWKSLSFGVVSTTLMQSSSLVSVITISFLSAEMIGLAQGIGIVFGANLGTTTGAWLVAGFGLKVKISTYAMPILVFGVMFVMQTSSRVKGLGWILVGIGFLFLGIHYMKEGFDAYAQQIDLSEYALTGIKGLLAFTLLGVVATVVMQSSHATLTLTITALAAGQVTYENALALAIGANVGTTITALLGSIGANISGKRLAVAHLLFNSVTGAMALALIKPLTSAVQEISRYVGIAADDYTLKLAVFHTLFNVLGLVIMVPLIGRLVEWLEESVKGAREDRDQPRYLSSASLELPEVACSAALKETQHLFDNAITLIAHGVNLHRSTIAGDRDLQSLLDSPAELIEVDLDEQYARMIKDIYGANVEFISRAQASASPDFSERFDLLRRANLEVVSAIKAVKHLRKNLRVYSRSRNLEVRREYNRFRIRIGSVLRDLVAQQEAEGAVVILLSLDHIRVEAVDADNYASRQVDSLIRSGSISPRVATSLINDGAYVREIVQHLLHVTEFLVRAGASPGELLVEEMSLQIEEIADIARRMDGAALADRAEDHL